MDAVPGIVVVAAAAVVVGAAGVWVGIPGRLRTGPVVLAEDLERDRLRSGKLSGSESKRMRSRIAPQTRLNRGWVLMC